MRGPSSNCLAASLLGLVLAAAPPLFAQIRDGGIDPNNLGQGGWLFLLNQATNHMSPNTIAAVTNEDSMFKYMKSQGLRYTIVKAGTSDTNYWDGTYSKTTPVFTSNLVTLAHANGLKIFGSNRSWGSNIVGEIAVADYVFNQGADGFIYDAEAEWEMTTNSTTHLADHPWITNGPAQAWWLCGTVRSNWPTKFVAHNPFDTLYLHSSFPYKEFGYWSDCVMPQVYHHAASQGNAFAAIHWTDVNYQKFQDSLSTLPPSVINGQTVYWTNSLKPLCLMRDVYGANFSTTYPSQDVMNFLDYLAGDPNCVTAGGYLGSDYFRSELHDANQWAYIKSTTVGEFSDAVNSLVMDDARASLAGAWTLVKTISATTGSVTFSGATGGDTNSFGTNYFCKGQGTGASYAQFTPNIVMPGNYAVYQWHPTRADASASTPHIITWNGGSTTVYANQQTNAGNWSLLGRFNFAAGSSGNIRVTDGIPESSGVAIADAIKLVFVPPTTAPTAPGTLSATAADVSQIDLAWTDTATNTMGYVIARSTASGGPYTPIGATGFSTIHFSDRGLSPGTTYFYQVQATNFAGGSPSAGPASATTFSLGPVRLWGDNSLGQVTPRASASNVIAIAVGAWHNLALRPDGTVLAWGDDLDGQCETPTVLTDALAIAAGGYHSLAIRANGTALGWGNNYYGQANIPPGLNHVIGVAAGTWHSLALKADSTVVAWGDNSYGQCRVPAGLSNVVSVAAGGSHSLALLANGQVVGWGENTDAQGYYSGQATPPLGLTNVVAITAGQYHSLAVLSNGRVVAWGDNSNNQCAVPVSLTNAVAAAAGGLHSLALKADGSVLAWGANWNGQCNLPVLSNVSAVGAGEAHSVALVADAAPLNRLISAFWQEGRFGALVQTLNRHGYALEYKASLTTTNWTPLSTNSGNGTLELLRDPNATGSQGFYRLRQW